MFPKITSKVVFWSPYTHVHRCAHTGTHKTNKQNYCYQMPTAVALATPSLTALTCLPISKRSEETKEVLDKKENTGKEPSTSREKFWVLPVHGPLQPLTRLPYFWPEVAIRTLVVRIPPGQRTPPSQFLQDGMWQKARKMRKDQLLAWLRFKGSQNRTSSLAEQGPGYGNWSLYLD